MQGDQSNDAVYVSDSHTLLQFSERYFEILTEIGAAWRKDLGDPAVLRHRITYDFYIGINQQRCQAVQHLLDEGVIAKAKLFRKGGDNNSVMRDIEAFDRDLLRRWEAGLKVRNAEERKLEYRIFLRDRSRTWNEGYARWRDASIKC